MAALEVDPLQSPERAASRLDNAIRRPIHSAASDAQVDALFARIETEISALVRVLKEELRAISVVRIDDRDDWIAGIGEAKFDCKKTTDELDEQYRIVQDMFRCL